VFKGFVSICLRAEPTEVKADASGEPSGSARLLADVIVYIVDDVLVTGVVLGWMERVDRGGVAEYLDLKTDS